MGLLHFAFVMFQLFRVSEAWPHNCDDREKTALMYDPGLSRQVSTTAHSAADDTLSRATQADKEENTTV